SKAKLAWLKEVAAVQPGNDGGRLLDDVDFAARIARVELELHALEIMNLKLVAAEGRPTSPGPEASMLKIKGSEIQQTLSELLALATGPYGVASLASEDPAYADGVSAAFNPELYSATGRYFNLRKTTIYGGANEIQKGIICKAILNIQASATRTHHEFRFHRRTAGAGELIAAFPGARLQRCPTPGL